MKPFKRDKPLVYIEMLFWIICEEINHRKFNREYNCSETPYAWYIGLFYINV